MVQLKQASSPGELADAMDEIDKTLDGIKRKPGRPKKFKNKLTSKQTLLLTKEQKEILDKIEVHFVENANEIIKKAFISKITPFKESRKKDIKIPEKTLEPEESSLPH